MGLFMVPSLSGVKWITHFNLPKGVRWAASKSISIDLQTRPDCWC